MTISDCVLVYEYGPADTWGMADEWLREMSYEDSARRGSDGGPATVRSAGVV